jgi:outer membrane protein TolC
MAFAVAAHSEEPVRLTLNQALEKAWAEQPTVRAAVEGVRTAQAQLKQARAGYLPTVNLTGAFTYNGKLPKSVLDFGGGNPFAAQNAQGTDNEQGDATELPVVEDPAQSDKPLEIEFGTRVDYRGIVQAQWPLFTWWKTTNGVRAAERNVVAAERRLDAARQGVALNVKEAFFGSLLTSEVVAVTTKAREQAERRLKTAQQRFEAGVATRLDILQAQVALANANTQVIRAGNAARVARQGLAVAIGLDPSASVEPEGSLAWEPETLDVEALVAKAIENRADLKELQSLEDAARYAVKIAEAANKPNVAMTGTATWFDNEQQNGQTIWSVGVGVSIPIFNGFADSARVRQAESGVRQAEIGQEALTNAIAFQVRQSTLAYQEAVAVLTAQEETLAQANEALRIANLSFENGLITSVELADAELGRTQAELLHVQALHDALVAKARLEKALGVPLAQP